jgi:acetyl-CoA carboxylase biotin carboxyl carrier protein
MESSDLDEIEWEEADRYLKVVGARHSPEQALAAVRPESRPASTVTRIAPAAPRSQQKAIAPKAGAGIAEDEVALVSPMVGVYYRSGKPGDPPMVEVGQVIARDQPIGIIEAMKIFSEIPAEAGGLVVAVPAQDGQLVQAGTPLVILKRQA